MTTHRLWGRCLRYQCLSILVQVMLMAMLLSAVCKKMDNDHDDIDDDEKPPELDPDEQWLHTRTSQSEDSGH